MNDSSSLRRALRALTATLAILTLSSAAAAQQAAAPSQPVTAPTTDTAQARTGAAVIFASDTLFVLHGQLGAFTAASRARAI